MNIAHRAGIAVLIAGAWIGCADETPPPEPAPAAAPTPPPPAPMLPLEQEVEETPSAQALPLADDFETEAAAEVTEETYLARLDELEKEISEAEEEAP